MGHKDPRGKCSITEIRAGNTAGTGTPLLEKMEGNKEGHLLSLEEDLLMNQQSHTPPVQGHMGICSGLSGLLTDCEVAVQGSNHLC